MISLSKEREINPFEDMTLYLSRWKGDVDILPLKMKEWWKDVLQDAWFDEIEHAYIEIEDVSYHGEKIIDMEFAFIRKGKSTLIKRVKLSSFNLRDIRKMCKNIHLLIQHLNRRDVKVSLEILRSQDLQAKFLVADTSLWKLTWKLTYHHSIPFTRQSNFQLTNVKIQQLKITSLCQLQTFYGGKYSYHIQKINLEISCNINGQINHLRNCYRCRRLIKNNHYSLSKIVFQKIGHLFFQKKWCPNITTLIQICEKEALWSVWMKLIFFGLIENLTKKKQWSIFLTQGLYDPRLLLLIWKFIEFH